MDQPDVKTTFLSRLQKARELRGVSQAALGHRMGLSKEIASTRINRYERGKSEPDLATAQAMADALGVSLSWMVCTDERLALIIQAYDQLTEAEREQLMAQLRGLIPFPEQAPSQPAATDTGAAKAPVDRVSTSERPPVRVSRSKKKPSAKAASAKKKPSAKEASAKKKRPTKATNAKKKSSTKLAGVKKPSAKSAGAMKKPQKKAAGAKRKSPQPATKRAKSKAPPRRR